MSGDVDMGGTPDHPEIQQDHAPLARPSFAADLHRHGSNPALITADGRTVTYCELADLVADTAARLGPTRRLVLVEAENSVESITTYLACLAGGHPVLMTAGGPDGRVASLVGAFDPDVVVGRDDGCWQLHARRDGSRHLLHPELAALLSTSGTTGSAKLVRLSATNLSSNAAAIASYLDLDADERALTALPLAYCYGLSVLNSHLQVGASLVLNDASVVDACFWDRLERHRATSFATVPHSFQLLDRIGFARDGVPESLRTVTQAGGRLAPDVVARYAETARQQGWRLVVMYGQTEATARMAYLPPELAATRPDAIGRPIPGGAFRIDAAPGAPEGVGELVYTGPNVMLGYATEPADLAEGRVVHELRTGDLARQAPDGLYEITGRTSRFVKLFGLRIGLDDVERVLAEMGHEALCAGSDDGLQVVVAGRADPARVQLDLAARLGIPPGSLAVAAVDALPRMASGKPDYAAVRAIAPSASRPRPRQPSPTTSPDSGTTDGPAAGYIDLTDGGARRARRSDPVGDVLRDVLRVERVDDHDTFVSLGGDSLSYVEVSYELEQVIGPLPPAWHQRPVGELRALVPDTAPPRTSTIDTTVLIRALAIVVIVAGHAELTTWEGGGHLLLGVAGYNTARFVVHGFQRSGRLRRGLTQIGRFAVPTIAYLAVVSLVVPGIHLSTVLLTSTYVQSGEWRYRLWFVEALAQILLVALALFCIPAVRRAERRAPFAFAVWGTVLGLALRELTFAPDDYEALRTHSVFWIFALGWAVQRADTTAKRLAVSLLALVGLVGWYDGGYRELVVSIGLILLAWAPTVPWPSSLRRPAVVLATASLAIYLAQWAVLDLLLGRMPAQLAVVLAIATGVLVWEVAEAVRSLRAPTSRAADGAGGDGARELRVGALALPEQERG